ncbi:MAG: hypothetical protein P0111_07795 [Nitrospira sp.]|nr:hypothetical protein [Nitrospira sp.]
MALAIESVEVRIEWCRQQRAKAAQPLEREGWHAEADGLRDALLSQDHSNLYRDCGAAVFERYALGLQDGRALMLVAVAEQQHAMSYR